MDKRNLFLNLLGVYGMAMGEYRKLKLDKILKIWRMKSSE